MVRHFESDSDALLVAFGGMAGHMGMPPFEFFRISQALDARKAYVRDLGRAWYHLGVPDLGTDIDAVAEALRGLVADSGAERVVFAGNSAGGFAALLFGAMLGVDEVMAFSPQTLLRVPELEEVGDMRWSGMIRKAAGQRGGALDERYVDLVPVLREQPPRDGTRFQVHYCQTFDLDAFHAERLPEDIGIELHGHVRGGHGVIRTLRNTGLLATMLEAAIAGEAPDRQLTAAMLEEASMPDDEEPEEDLG